ncbi:extracellular solute-binding protein [Paenibacillus flagellatus]|uniref:ABC transporter substrate-binding protein n=1 Tax=Paenibacillus flagellatus TaxID=2211139 RepID=A0A2V5K226_9BACL|nr:extracellular solute-binding protein [Paenibacillus flagellatus]PYI51583.1 ABC transporter substrate-binding protein [Paenibacillus flagellatus]
MKKAIAGIASLALAFSVLAACGAGKDDATGASGGQTGTEANVPKPELRQLGFARNFDPNQDPVAKFLEDKTGYKVKYEALPLENTDDKLNLLMANKEPYDILKLSGSQYNRLAAQGALEPLDELLAKYGKTLLAVNDPETFENAKVDGKIYGIPEKHPRAFVGSSLAVRQDLLDELGMKVPTTLDEFYELLKAIKAKKGIIPFSGFESIVPEISGAFGIVTSFEDRNGKLIHRLEDPGMKEYLAFMNKLYTEGLLDQEWPVNKSATVQQKFTSGKAGVITYGWGVAPAVTTALEKNFPNSKIAIIPSLKGKDGQASNWLQGGGVSWYIAIPKSSKHKEDAMKYLDLKVQPDTFKALAVGEENVEYKTENGKMFPILPRFNESRGNADWFITSTDAKAYEELWLLRVRKDNVLYNTFEEIQKQASISVKDPTLLAPPLPVVGNNMQKLNKLENDYIVKAIAGAEKLDGYDNFVKQWNGQGGTEVLQALSDWYAKSKK